MWVLVLFTILGTNGNLMPNVPLTSTVIHYFKTENACIEAGHVFVKQNRVKDFRADGNLWQVGLAHRFHCVEIAK